MTHALRRDLLRPGLPLSQMAFAGDEELQTLHLGAFESKTLGGQAIGIASLYAAATLGDAKAGDWQLRGMAVDRRWQRQGVGARLVHAAITELTQRAGRRLWCNARLSAQDFYAKLGFAGQSDVFHIEGVGPHVVMSIAVRPEPR